MRSRTISMLVCLGALLPACSAAQNAVPAAPTTLALVERATTDAITDVGATGDSVGDVLTFANEVFDAQNQTKQGTDNGYCLRTAAGVAWECEWTLTLADGQIMAAGPFLDAGDSKLAITGGTGAYAEARGELALHARNADGTEYDFGYVLHR